MKFYSVKSERNYLLNVAFHIVAVGVQRAESPQSIGIFSDGLRNKMIYRRDLFRGSCDRLHDKRGYSRFFTHKDKVFGDSETVGVRVVKGVGSLNGSCGYLFGVDMAMSVNDEKTVFHAVTTPFAFSRPSFFIASALI